MPTPSNFDDLSVQDIMTAWPATISVFLKHKMICVGCLVAPFHTIAEACAEHDIDEDGFRNELIMAAKLL